MKLNKTLEKNHQFETDVLIIGAGPVGLFAAFQAGLLGMKSIVVDALEDIGGQLTFLYPNKYIYDIPGFPKILAKDLIKELAIQTQNYNPLFLIEQTAEQLSKEGVVFKIVTSKNNSIKAKAVIIAGGAGTFKPQKLPLNGLEEFEKETILYSVTNPQIFKNKKVVIIGGGDSAVDWALHLSEDIASNVYLIHRRNHFRALPASLSKLNNNKRCELVVPYGVKGVEGNGTKVTKITIEHFISKKQKNIEVDYILPFFGLNRSLGSLLKWNLNIDTINSTIIVNPITCETNIEGIFAVGDIAKYDHKLKLIMVGFSEASYALHNAWKYVFPNKPFHFLHSTSKN